jgi:ribosomal protein S13
MRKFYINSNFENNKNINQKLKKIKKIYGIGAKTIVFFSKKFGINLICSKKIKLTQFSAIDKIAFELAFGKILINKLISIRKFNIFTIKNYASTRHVSRYPARGQRTKTNSNTRKKFKTELEFLT